MNMRITTNMVKNSYQYNLQKSTRQLSDSRDKVLTQRTFTSYAEDPAAATLSFRLRRSWYQTNNYLANTTDVYSKFNTAWHNLTGVVEELSDRTARVSSIRGNNEPTGEARRALAIDLRETAESVIQAMNQKFGDHFIFAGNDALNPPFSWSSDGTILYYRGVNVNAGGVKNPADPPDWGEIDPETGLPANMPQTGTSAYDRLWMQYYEDLKQYNEDMAAYEEDGGVTLPEPTKPESPAEAEQPDWVKAVEDYVIDEYGTIDKEKLYEEMDLEDIDLAWLDYYQDQADLQKLQAMSGEEMYIDLGMGAAESSPNSPVKGTYFNSALCGIDFLGFGVDKDGDPLNLALIMKELADVFETWDEDIDPQGYNPDLAKGSAAGLSSAELEAKAMRLMDKLKAAQENTTEHWVELDANSVYLQTTESRLAIQASDLNIQFLDIEQMDLAEAITNFSWDYMCYNSALKIGNQLLGQSLIDYMS